MGIDWSQILNDLRHNYNQIAIDHKLTSSGLSAIGHVVDSDSLRLNRLARGDTKEPKYSMGVKLLALHDKYCKG